MKIRYSCITDKGSVRKVNEDSILSNGEIINFQDHYESPEIFEITVGDEVVSFAVADGMGGHEAGEIASRIALEKFSSRINEAGNFFLDDHELLKESIRSIHKEVNEFGILSNKAGMGTTLVGTIFSSEKFIVFNVGDSRLYIFRDGYLAQKTRDHSLSEMLGGKVPKNFITSSIGGGVTDIIIDIYDLTGRIRRNDLIIICSDGLTDIDMDNNYDTFESIIKDNITDLQALNRELLSFSLSKGSADNVTVVSISVIDT